MTYRAQQLWFSVNYLYHLLFALLIIIFKTDCMLPLSSGRRHMPDDVPGWWRQNTSWWSMNGSVAADYGEVMRRLPSSTFRCGWRRTTSRWRPTRNTRVAEYWVNLTHILLTVLIYQYPVEFPPATKVGESSALLHFSRYRSVHTRHPLICGSTKDGWRVDGS